VEKLMFRQEERSMDWVLGPPWATAPIQLVHPSYPIGGSTTLSLSQNV